MNEAAAETKRMVTVAGTATSRGFVSGPVFLYAGDRDVALPEYTLPAEKVGAELARYREALSRFGFPEIHFVYEPVAAAFFFCVLTALMLLRPVRDALGMSQGMDQVRWLFIGTALVTLAVNPAFGWVVSRFRRMQFIAITYGFFALSLTSAAFIT